MSESARGVFTVDRILLVLLLFVPAALLMELALGIHGTPVFIASAVAIIPLAGYMGRATERLAEHLGAGWGGFLNATFGNAAELIIAMMALRAGLMDVVKASLTGSIIGNLLLVLGLSILVGGLKFPPIQRFNRTAASMGATMLLLATVGLVLPAIFHHVVGDGSVRLERGLSLDISIVLMITYVLGLVFSFRTHSHLYLGTGAAMDHAPAHEEAPAHGSASRALGLLLLSAAAVGVMSELMVGALEEAAHDLGMNQVFVGVILVALVGNAAEHSTAVIMAAKNKMDLSVNIAVGSSIQIAMFIAPLLVFLSYVIGPAPMDLHFTALEVVAVVLSTGVMALVSLDGESHWMEGVQLLAVYVMLGLAFFFLPV
ncbi:MAG: calcium/proton exchanger [marine benthic group bacterium]|nr:calcium/proton exchanger [Candidatus Benthicola marisminoris]